MRWQERQDAIEAEVYDAIDELADGLKIKMPYYPTVFWLGRTLRFEDLGLPVSGRASFERRRKSRESHFIPRNTIVIDVKYDFATISEEASHFVHYSVSKASFRSKSISEAICLRAISEALGIFGSRFLGSSRKDNFELVPDLSRMSEDDWQCIIDACPDYFQTYGDFCEFYAHQQGYGLGDRIYFEYLAGRVSIKFIRSLFLDPLAGKDSAIKKFIRLKRRFWPADK